MLYECILTTLKIKYRHIVLIKYFVYFNYKIFLIFKFIISHLKNYRLILFMMPINNLLEYDEMHIFLI